MSDLSNPALTALTAMLKRVAASDGIDIPDVSVRRMISRQWHDSCLGFPSPGEVCAEVVTPGFVIDLDGGHRFHVSHTGDVRSSRTPTVDNEIRVRFERDGGFIGGHEQYNANSWTLSEGDEAELRRLIENCSFFELRSGMPTPFPDVFVYTLWIAIGRRSHTVMFSDGDPMPNPAIGDLLTWLSARLPSSQASPVLESPML